MAIRNGVTVRGTSNKNKNGSAESRRRRKVWLIETYRANVDVLRYELKGGHIGYYYPSHPEDQEAMMDRLGGSLLAEYDWAADVTSWEALPACRCYRCGTLLIFETVTVDRIVPGCVKTKKYPNGGTYVRENIRPSCENCMSLTGGKLRSQAVQKAARKRHR